MKEGLSYNCCELFAGYYQQDVLLVAGYLYLASIFDECGIDPAVGGGYREDALHAIHEKFNCVLDTDYLPCLGNVDSIPRDGYAHFVSYMEKLKTRELDAKARFEGSPFERFWGQWYQKVSTTGQSFYYFSKETLKDA